VRTTQELGYFFGRAKEDKKRERRDFSVHTIEPSHSVTTGLAQPFSTNNPSKSSVFRCYLACRAYTWPELVGESGPVFWLIGH
jgi:hypothetical protein